MRVFKAARQRCNRNTSPFPDLTLLALVIFTTLFGKLCSAADYRLPQHISITEQHVVLRIDPRKTNYTGSTSMQLSIKSAANVIAYHSRDLAITSVELMVDGQTTKLTPTLPDEYDMVRHQLAAPVTGQVMLKIGFSGKLGDKVEGFFRRESNLGEPYMFSQFQEMEARSAFPSFDAPSMKTVFQFAVTIPEDVEALHTTRVESITLENNWKRVLFAKTTRQNTDVLALAVGKFDSLTLSKTSLKSTFYFPAGLTLSLPENTDELINNSIQYIAEYLDKPFPYKKLDFFVAPISTLAAMENVGLVALNPNQIPEDVSDSREICNFNKLIAHEIAHMWFGNSITMDWYDDFWMNESFAEFMASKVLAHHYPDNIQCTFAPQRRGFGIDLPNARPLKAEVRTRENIESIGQMAYTKGRSILEMQELATGKDAFQTSMQQYVAAVSDGNTNSDAYLVHFSEYPFMKNFIDSFLEQPGYPLITLSDEQNKLILSQQSFALITEKDDSGEDSSGKKATDQLWTVPLTIKEFDGRKEIEHKLILTTQSQTFIPLSHDSELFLDGGGMGYFRYLNKSQQKLSELNRLSKNETAAYLDNAQAIAEKSLINYADYLDELINTLSHLPHNSEESERVLTVLQGTFVELIPEYLAKSYAQYLYKKLPKVDNWLKVIKDNNGGAWLSFYGIYLQDKRALSAAKALLADGSWKAHPHRLEILRVVAMSADNNEYQKLLGLFDKAATPVREDLLNALGYVSREEQVLHFYDFLLSGRTKEHVIDYRFQFPAFQPRFRALLAKFIQDNKNQIAGRIASDSLQWFPYNFLTACSAEEAFLVSSAFANWLEVPGLDAKLLEVTEKIRTCASDAEKSLQSIKAAMENSSRGTGDTAA